VELLNSEFENGYHLRLQTGQIGHDIADLRFGEDAEHGGHDADGWGGGGDLCAGYSLEFSVGEFEADLLRVFLVESAGEAFAVLEGEGDEAITGGDDGERVQKGFKEVWAVLGAADGFQIGADLAAFFGFDGVAGDAVGTEVIGDEVATAGDIAAFEEFGVLGLESGEFGIEAFAGGGGFEDVELDGGGGFVLREEVEPLGDDGVVFR
jgi:hypothetical protein